MKANKLSSTQEEQMTLSQLSWSLFRWGKVSYNWAKYKLIKIENNEISFVHNDSKNEKPLKIKIWEIFEAYKEWKFRILDKFHAKNEKLVAKTSEKVAAITEQKEEKIMITKIKILTALGLSLWADKRFLEPFIQSISVCYKDFWNIDCSLNEQEQKSKFIWAIKAFWIHFLDGKRNNLSYKIWIEVLKFLRNEDISWAQSYLEGQIYLITDWDDTDIRFIDILRTL